jgi:hypothetical protein
LKASKACITQAHISNSELFVDSYVIFLSYGWVCSITDNLKEKLKWKHFPKSTFPRSSPLFCLFPSFSISYLKVRLLAWQGNQHTRDKAI